MNGGYRGAVNERDFIEQRECPECGREVGEHHKGDCVLGLCVPRPEFKAMMGIAEGPGLPSSRVDQGIAVTVRYVREGS